MTRNNILLALCISIISMHSTIFSMEPASQSSQQHAQISDAINSDDYDTVAQLVEEGVSANTKIGGRAPALLIAAIREKNNSVRALLDKGAQKNATDFYGNTAAHWAAFTGNIDCLVLLKDRRAKLDANNRIGNNPLAIAIKRTPPAESPENKNFTECVILLLASNEDESDNENEDSD